MKKIYYSENEAKQAAENIMNENANYTMKTGSMDLGNGEEESESFASLVGTASGETAAYVIEDERGQIVAKFGYWDTESVELAQARKAVEGAVATWNADPFCVEGEIVEDVAEFISREDVDEKVVNDSDVDEEEWANLAAMLDLNPGDMTVLHIFESRDNTERLYLCHAEDHE